MLFSRVAIAVAVVCLLGTPASGGTKYAGEFMAIGGGARPLGMGGAFIAVAADVSTVYWNPAGLSGMKKRQALLMHSERFGDLVNYNFATYGQPTTMGGEEREAAWGAGLLHLGVDDQPITSQYGFVDANGNGEFDSGDYLVDANGNPVQDSGVKMESDNSFAFIGSYAIRTGFGRLGGNLKIIYVDAIAGVTATGIGIDLGYLRENLFVKNLSVGAKLQDATGTYLSWSTGTNEFVSPTIKLGTAYRYDSESFNGSVILAADGDFYFQDRQTGSQFWAGSASVDLHLGLELIFQESVMVRGGFDTGNLTAGAGLRVAMLGFDYAYLAHDDFDATHRVSVLAEF